MANLSIPKNGLKKEDILSTLQSYKEADANWKAGRVFCLVYDAGEAHQQLMKDVYAVYSAENALNPTVFKSLKRVENEVVRMAVSLMHGDEQAVGTMTSGGTESILMAVKTARDRARKLGPKTSRPNMVVPETAHVAFDKAGKYFGLEVRYARSRKDFRVDIADVKRLCDKNTVLLVGSAPQYVQGVVDPIEELGRLAQKKKIPLHVDACVGGFQLPWLEKLGRPIPPWDFRVPGVTSISADVHKFGYSAKGSSVVLYRDISYLRHQFFVSTNWPGGVYASPSALGTRSGGAIAQAWASLKSLGEDGYLMHTQRAWKARETLLRGLETIPELELLGAPDATIVSFRTSEASGLDIFALADAMEARGWIGDRQQRPPSIHLTCMSQHQDVMPQYVEDLKAAVAQLKKSPPAKNEGWAPVYGMMAKVPFRGMVYGSVLKAMETMYGPDALEDRDPLAASPDESVVDRLVREHGDKLNAVLDRVDSVKKTLKLRPRRPTQKR